MILLFNIVMKKLGMSEINRTTILMLGPRHIILFTSDHECLVAYILFVPLTFRVAHYNNNIIIIMFGIAASI